MTLDRCTCDDDRPDGFDPTCAVHGVLEHAVGIEARCTRCGATFNPSGEETYRRRPGSDDVYVEHYVTDDGDPCGGYGLVVGSWRGGAS